MALPPQAIAEQVSGYGWNEAAGQYYRLDNKRFVKRIEVRDAFEKAIDATKADMRRVSTALQNGEISVAEWRGEMMRYVKRVHVAESCAARGGWAQMSQADWGAVGGRIKRQYQYLENFAQEIHSGKYAVTGGNFLNRVDMYADAGRGTYERTVTKLMTDRGYTEERNVLGVADHCPECLAETARGWVPIGTLIPIGNRICLTNCHCEKEYRKVER